MSSENRPANDLASGLRAEIEGEDRASCRRAKIGIAVRVVLIVAVFGYMTWISGAVSKLGPAELTRISATTLEHELPQMRAQIRDYAVEMAPELTDRARDMLVQLPAQLREYLETRLLEESDALIVRFETEVDQAITGIVESQMELARDALPGRSPEEQLDAVVLGVSDAFRDTVIEALDEMYYDYSESVRNLNGHLDRLLVGEELSENDELDRQLIGAWMVLVYKHDIAKPSEVIAGLQLEFQERE